MPSAVLRAWYEAPSVPLRDGGGRGGPRLPAERPAEGREGRHDLLLLGQDNRLPRDPTGTSRERQYAAGSRPPRRGRGLLPRLLPGGGGRPPPPGAPRHDRLAPGERPP